jgi:hypothetical protein
MKRILVALLLGATAALGLAPAAHADENSYISRLENSSTVTYTGTKGVFINVGYRVCSDWSLGHNRGYIWNQIYLGLYDNGMDYSWTGSQEITAAAIDELCPS